MKIYRLSPNTSTTNNRAWEISLHKPGNGDVIVRAESEDRARNLVLNATLIAAIVRPNMDTLLVTDSPWLSKLLVTVSEEFNSEFDTNGKEEILFPDRLSDM